KASSKVGAACVENACEVTVMLAGERSMEVVVSTVIAARAAQHMGPRTNRARASRFIELYLLRKIGLGRIRSDVVWIARDGAGRMMTGAQPRRDGTSRSPQGRPTSSACQRQRRTTPQRSTRSGDISRVLQCVRSSAPEDNSAKLLHEVKAS